MESIVKKLIENKDFNGLRELLADNSGLANEDITIPYDVKCKVKGHPLHRLCDAVFAGKMTEDEAIILAEIFLEYGADIDGGKNGGTPLLAAASLHAEKLGIFYIGKGADVNLTDEIDNASALHWAAFCGRDKLVAKLINSKASIDECDKTYQCTPLGWAIENLMSNDKGNKHNQVACIKLFLQSGANIKKLSARANEYLHFLGENDPEINSILKTIPKIKK